MNQAKAWSVGKVPHAKHSNAHNNTSTYQRTYTHTHTNARKYTQSTHPVETVHIYRNTIPEQLVDITHPRKQHAYSTDVLQSQATTAYSIETTTTCPSPRHFKDGAHRRNASRASCTTRTRSLAPSDASAASHLTTKASIISGFSTEHCIRYVASKGSCRAHCHHRG